MRLVGLFLLFSVFFGLILPILLPNRVGTSINMARLVGQAIGVVLGGVFYSWLILLIVRRASKKMLDFKKFTLIGASIYTLYAMVRGVINILS